MSNDSGERVLIVEQQSVDSPEDDKLHVPGMDVPEAVIRLAPRREEIRAAKNLLSYAKWRVARLQEIIEEDAMTAKQDAELLGGSE